MLKPPSGSPFHHPAPTQVLHKGDDHFRSRPRCRHLPAARPHASYSVRRLHNCMGISQSGPAPCHARRTRHKDRNCDVGMGAQARLSKCSTRHCGAPFTVRGVGAWGSDLGPGGLSWHRGCWGSFESAFHALDRLACILRKQGFSISADGCVRVHPRISL